MSRTSSLVQRMRARRNSRDFERAMRSADPSMQAELRAIAAQHNHRIF